MQTLSEIRIAGVHDIPAMLPLINQAFSVETFLEGPRTSAEELLEMLGTGDFLLAFTDDELVASVYTEVRGSRGYFGMLAVGESHQGTGLGRRMIEEAEQHCRISGCDHMDITVLSLRTELPPFYSKLGYVETGTKPFETPQRLAEGLECWCIVMSKWL